MKETIILTLLFIIQFSVAGQERFKWVNELIAAERYPEALEALETELSENPSDFLLHFFFGNVIITITNTLQP